MTTTSLFVTLTPPLPPSLPTQGEVSSEQMKNILNHLNTTASWFGDPSLSPEEVDKLVTEVFEKHDENKSGTLSYVQYMHAVAENPMLVQFVNGEGTVKSQHSIVLPVWWARLTLVIGGEWEGKGEEFVKGCEEFTKLVGDARKMRACKSSVFKSSMENVNDFALLQEWHGPIEDALYKESAFWKKVEGMEGVEIKLEKWKTVDF